MREQWAGQVAVITGAAQGIGAAIVHRIAQAGASVVGIDRNRERLDHLATESVGITPYVADVQDHGALEHIVNDTIARHGRIDVLVNNAGLSYYTPFFETTLEQWQHTQHVNLEAQFILCKLVAPHMIRAGYGRIVNISSTQSFAVEPLVSAYAASKAGINALTRSLAVELAPYNIIVNAIAPGCIHTPMSVVNGVDETQTEDFQEWYIRRRKIPLGRPGQADEIAHVAVFLASAACSYLTGQVIVVDGGLTITF
jgi:NAD(P)-dependent dehydrogenase (short-subunit alcohol dehydrogenase family)